MLIVTTPLRKCLCHVGVLMLVHIRSCSSFRAVGFTHVTLYQPSHCLPRADVCAQMQKKKKKTILLCLGLCDPGADVTDVTAVCCVLYPLE